MHSDCMTNPYDAPEHAGVLTLADISPPTRLQLLVRAVCFSIGCVIGLNLSVALDDGVKNAARRTTIDPLTAVSFFTAVSLVCLLLVSIWKWLRSRFLQRYHPNAAICLGCGFLLTLTWCALLWIAETFGVINIRAMLVTLCIATPVVVEVEAYVVRFTRNVTENT